MQLIIGIIAAFLINLLANTVPKNREPFAPLIPFRCWRFGLLFILTPILFWLTKNFSTPTNWIIVGFIALLLLLIVLDLEYKWVPHVLTGTGTVSGIGLAETVSFNSLQMSLFGAFVSFFLFLILFFLGQKLFGHGAMGVGDITLATMSGAMLGLHQVIFALPFALLIGGIVSGLLLLFRIAKHGDHLPYGHYIAISTIIFLLWGEPIFRWYTHM